MRRFNHIATVGSVAAAMLLFACLAAGCASEGNSASSGAESDVQSLSELVGDRPASDSASGVPAGGGSSSKARDMSGLQGSLEDLVQSYSGSYAVACSAVDGSWSVGVNGSDSLVSASVIKLAILGTLLDQAQRGMLSLDDAVTVSSSDIVGGTGVIQAMGAGGSYSYRQLATYMIQDSDNVATNLIIDAVGMSSVNEFANSIGLSSTVLNRRMMDFSTGTENYVSADDVAKILSLIGNGGFVSADMSDFALGLLEGQHDTSGLLEGLPDGVVFAHKTGDLDNVFNDAGIVLGDEPYIMVALTNDASAADSQEFMTTVAQLTSESA